MQWDFFQFFKENYGSSYVLIHNIVFKFFMVPMGEYASSVFLHHIFTSFLMQAISQNLGHPDLGMRMDNDHQRSFCLDFWMCLSMQLSFYNGKISWPTLYQMYSSLKLLLVNHISQAFHIRIIKLRYFAIFNFLISSKQQVFCEISAFALSWIPPLVSGSAPDLCQIWHSSRLETCVLWNT